MYSGLSGRASSIPKLEQLAIRTIILNLDALGDMGDIPEEYKQKIMTACTHDQLEQLERHNPKKLDSESLWERHCSKVYHISEKSHRTWRETFFRAKEEELRKRKLMKDKLKKVEKLERAKLEANSTKFIEPPAKQKASTFGNAMVKSTSLRQRVSLNSPMGGGITKGGGGKGLFQKAVADTKARSKPRV